MRHSNLISRQNQNPVMSSIHVQITSLVLTGRATRQCRPLGKMRAVGGACVATRGSVALVPLGEPRGSAGRSVHMRAMGGARVAARKCGTSATGRAMRQCRPLGAHASDGGSPRRSAEVWHQCHWASHEAVPAARCTCERWGSLRRSAEVWHQCHARHAGQFTLMKYYQQTWC